MKSECPDFVPADIPAIQHGLPSAPQDGPFPPIVPFGYPPPPVGYFYYPMPPVPAVQVGWLMLSRQSFHSSDGVDPIAFDSRHAVLSITKKQAELVADGSNSPPL